MTEAINLGLLKKLTVEVEEDTTFITASFEGVNIDVSATPKGGQPTTQNEIDKFVVSWTKFFFEPYIIPGSVT